jgi:hypothetical protein
LRQTPSINFSRPYSSRSSTFSNTSPANEADRFSIPKATSPQTEEHLSVPLRSPGTESSLSSPGLGDEDINNLPRGRRKSKPVLDTGVFFHTHSLKRSVTAHRWPVTPPPDSSKKFLPSPEPQDDNLSITSTRSRETRSVSPAPPVPPIPLKKSGSVNESQRQQSQSPRSSNHETRPRSSTNPHSKDHRYTLHPPPFNPPNQNRKRSQTTISETPSESMTPEENLSLGIKFHEQNQLPQGTYRFRLAAQAGNPTGMLFYSLSLRHGWGCAPNPEKAVEWLHSAAECASAHVDENGDAEKGITFTSEEKKRESATLALAIYELGQSYINGWGVQKDKHLGLRCFEISANLGDTDGQWYLLLLGLLILVKLRGVIYMESGRRRMSRGLRDTIGWQRNEG